MELKIKNDNAYFEYNLNDPSDNTFDVSNVNGKIGLVRVFFKKPNHGLGGGSFLISGAEYDLPLAKEVPFSKVQDYAISVPFKAGDIFTCIPKKDIEIESVQLFVSELEHIKTHLIKTVSSNE